MPDNRDELISFKKLVSADEQRSAATSRSRDVAATASVASPTFTFRINPTRLKRSQPKVQGWPLTKAGYERKYWNEDLITFSYEGSTGVFQPTVAQVTSGEVFDIRTSKAYRTFTEFKRFYRTSGKSNILMTIWDEPYPFEGMLDKFDYTLDSERTPKHIIYSFVFTGFPFDYVDIQTPQSVAGR